MRTTEQECLDALQNAAERLGKSPTKAEYEELDLRPASTTIIRLLGSWNRAKERANLETYRRGEFGGTDIQPKPSHVNLPESVEWKSLSAQQRWYYKNRQHRIEVKEARREALKKWFYDLKRNELECSECGEGTPPALDLHHDGAKKFDVSEMVNDGFSKERIRTEISRCTPLCANCHRKEHYSGPDPSALGTLDDIAERAADAPTKEGRKLRLRWLLAYRRDSNGCSHCDTAFPPCLDFHHEEEKQMRVGQMVSFDYSIPEIQEEIDKCILLCANCHRVEHHNPPTEVD